MAERVRGHRESARVRLGKDQNCPAKTSSAPFGRSERNAEAASRVTGIEGGVGHWDVMDSTSVSVEDQKKPRGWLEKGRVCVCLSV